MAESELKMASAGRELIMAVKIIYNDAKMIPWLKVNKKWPGR